MSRSILVGAVSLAALIASVPVHGHHAFAAEYDRDKPITLTGAMTKLEWTNPHARIYIDVKDDKGEVVNWDFELAAQRPHAARLEPQLAQGRSGRHD